jgi:hypothetical protein
MRFNIRLVEGFKEPLPILFSNLWQYPATDDSLFEDYSSIICSFFSAQTSPFLDVVVRLRCHTSNFIVPIISENFYHYSKV